jgi:metal-responsive CopG/Arc/MetJ family transcriptional regulator
MEKRVQIGIKLPQPLIDRVDSIRAQMEFPPDRTQIIERAIIEWCERFERNKAKGKKR